MPPDEPRKSQKNAKRPRRWWWRRRVVYPAVYLLFVVFMIFGGCADRIILHPSNDPVGLGGARRVEVPNGNGGVVEVWAGRTTACRGREPAGFVLAFIGNADRAEYALERTIMQWDREPVEVWAVNYPAFGGSTGPVSMRGSADAAVMAYDARSGQAGGRPVFASGLSFGTAAALHVAAERPVAGLVLHNPPPLRQLILGRFGWWNLWLLAWPVAYEVPGELDSVANAKRVTAPVVFVLASNDEVVPPAYALKVVAAHAGEHRVVHLPGAGHNDMPEAAQLQELRDGIDWLRSKAGATPTTRP